MKYKYLMLILLSSIVLLVGTISAAECVATYSDAYISCGNNSACEFGIGSNPEDLTLVLTSEYGVIKDVKAIIQLYEPGATKPIKKLNVQTGPDGTAAINFNYELKKKGSYSITGTINPGEDNELLINNLINVKQGLAITLSCPPQGIIDRDITCDLKVQDVESLAILSVTPIFTITQAGEDIVYNYDVSSRKVTFKTDSTGSVDVVVNIDYTGYVFSSDETQIEINTPTLNEDLLIDNNDFFSYSTSGVDVGIRKLTLKIDKSGESVDVLEVEAAIKTPSGQEVPLTFIQKGNIFETTFNFEQAGYTYHMIGQVVFSGEDNNLPFEYSILTSRGIEETYTGTTTLLVAGGIILGVIILGFFMFLIFRRRK